MTPLLGTKNPSAPVGDKSGGDRRAARSLLSCAAMARHGRPPSPTPATRPVGFSPATNHETRFSPVPAAIPRTATPSPTNRFSRITKHESRLLCFPSHHFPRFPGISRHFPALPPHPYQIPGRRPPFSLGLTKSAFRWKSHKSAQNPGSHRKMREAQRSPRIPSPSGLAPLRRTQHETMLRKGNVLSCVIRRTFSIALTRREGPLRLRAGSAMLRLPQGTQWLP